MPATINQNTRYMDNSNEIFPTVDADGNVTGKITRGEAHNGSRILHPVVHMHVFNTNGDLYLQRRPEWKDIQPGKWDTATGGHVDYGEDIKTALKREVREELGIEIARYQSLGHYIYDSKTERELVYVNIMTYDGTINPNDEELAGGRFWTKTEIADNIGKGVFTPNFEEEYIKYIKDL